MRIRELVASTSESNGPNPSWSGKFMFPIADACAILELTVMAGTLKIGKWSIALWQLLRQYNSKTSGWFALANKDGLKDGKSGEIHVDIQWCYVPPDDASWKAALPKSARLPTPLEQLSLLNYETGLRIGNPVIFRRRLKVFPIHFICERFVLRNTHLCVSDLFHGRKGSSTAATFNPLVDGNIGSVMRLRRSIQEQRTEVESVHVRCIELTSSHELQPRHGQPALTLWDLFQQTSRSIIPKLTSARTRDALQIALKRGYFIDGGYSNSPKHTKYIADRAIPPPATHEVTSSDDSVPKRRRKTGRDVSEHRRSIHGKSSRKQRIGTKSDDAADAIRPDSGELGHVCGLVDMRKPRGTCAWRARYVEVKGRYVNYSGVRRDSSSTNGARQLWTRTLDLSDCYGCEYDIDSNTLTLLMGGQKPGPVLLRPALSTLGNDASTVLDLGAWRVAILLRIDTLARMGRAEPFALITGTQEDNSIVSPPLKSSEHSMTIAEELRQALLHSYESSDEDVSEG